MIHTQNIYLHVSMPVHIYIRMDREGVNEYLSFRMSRDLSIVFNVDIFVPFVYDRLCVAVFSRVPCVLTVYLRDEPLFTLDCGPAGTSLAGTSLTSLTSLTHAGHTGDTGDTHVDKGGPRGGPSAQRSHRPSFLGQTRAALPRTLRDANVDSAAMDRIKRFSHSCGQVDVQSICPCVCIRVCLSSF
jgi:hypothetical protein